MPPENQSQEEFLKDLEPKVDADPFNQPLVPEEAPIEETPKEDSDEEKSNRRTRRLETKLQAEREAGIALAARLDALTEAQKFRGETAEVDETIARIYGTNTPEAAEATALLAKALGNVEERATKRALESFREEQQKQADAVQKEEQTLDSMVEDIEDEYGTTFDANSKKAFYQQLEKLSPKDRDGNIVAYADPRAVYEDMQSRKPAPNNRAKELASRSRTQSGASPSTTVEQTSNERWMLENGII